MATSQNLVKVSDHLSLNNGTTGVDLKAGQANVIKAKAGEHYRIILQKEGVSKLLDNVIVKREGADLQLQYADGTQLTLSNYYNEAKGDTGCDIALPGQDGIDYIIGENNALGTELGDGTTLMYAHGDHNILMSMAPGDTALQNTLADVSGNELSYIPGSLNMARIAGINPWWVATGLAAIGGGVAAGVGLGGGSTSGENTGSNTRNANQVAVTAIQNAAINNTAATSGLSVATYVTAGVTGVTSSNLAAINSALDSVLVDGSKTSTTALIQAIVNDYNAILTKSAAGGRDAAIPALTVAQFTSIGVTGVTSSNLAAINSALDSVLVDGSNTSATALIQTIVTDYNAILASADGLAGNTTLPLTTAQYTNIGVTNVPTGNALGLLDNVIDGLATTAVSTRSQVQALADAANAVMTGAAGGTAPTLAQLVLLGIKGVTAGNLGAVQQAIAATLDSGTGVNTQALLQAVATATELVSNAIAAIQNAAINNTAATSGLSVATYVTAGVTGVTSSNLAAINSALDSVLVDGSKTSTTALIQAIVTDYNAILASADNLAGNTTSALTTAQYTNIGVTNVPTGNALGLLGNVIDGLVTTAVSTRPQVQALADAANAVMTGAAGGTAPTLAQLVLLGIKGVTAGNLVAVQQAIAATSDNGSGVNNQSLLQAVATAAELVSNAITAIQDAAINNTAVTSGLSVATYVTAGVTGVTSSNLAAINSALDSVLVDGSKTSTAALIQSIVTDYNAILASADGLAGNTTPALTSAQYTSIGVTNVPTGNALGLLGNIIDGLAATAVNTGLQVQALVDAANAVMTGAAGGAAPTLAQLVLLGIKGVTVGNLGAVQQAIAATSDNGTGVNNQSLLQAVATAGANAGSTSGENTDSNPLNAIQVAVIAIQNAAQNNTATTTTPSVDTYTTAGVTGVTSSNLAAINSALDSVLVDGSKTSTTALIQTIVSSYAAILAEANDAVDSAGDTTVDATPLVGPTVAQYTAIGVTLGTAATVAANLNLLNDIVGAKQFADVDTVGEINALAVIANAIQTVAAGGTASPTLTVADLTKAGLNTTNLTPDNMAAVIAAIAAQNDTGTATDSLAKLQTILDAALVKFDLAIDKIADYAETGLVAPVTQDYIDAGVSGVSSTNLAAINDAINNQTGSDTILGNANDRAGADTAAKAQTIVSASAAILAEANDAADTAGDGTPDATPADPTAVQYAAIGATIGTAATVAANLNLLNDIVGAKQFADVDTVGEINALAVIANAIQTVAAGGTASPVLTTADFTKAGLTAVTDSNLSAVITAIAAKDNGGLQTDSLGELQIIINSTNISGTPPVLTTVLGGVTNLDVTSNLVLTSTRPLNVGTGFIRITDLGGSNGGTGFHNDTKTNSVNIDVTGGLLSFDTTGTKITINPTFDLDLSSNYSISIDQGAFVDQSTGALSQTLAAVNFSTVTPGTHSTGGTLAGDVHASQIMDANGALQPSKSWIDLESYNTNNLSGVTQIGDLNTGAYALVMKNYATAPGGVYPNPEDGGSVGIQLHDVSIGVTNFTANDQLYFDGQANNLTIQKFAPEYLSAILNAGTITGGIAGQNLLNFDYDTVGYSPSGSSNQIALGFQNSTTIFQYIYPYDGFAGMSNTLNIPFPVVMG